MTSAVATAAPPTGTLTMPPPTTSSGAPRASFSNSFWGDKGLEVLLARMKQGKHLSEEVHTMLKERASMEEDYGRRLAKLAKTFNPKDELGTLRESLDIVRSEIERSSRAHLDLANELRVKLEKPLQEFIANQSTIRKTHQRLLEKHLSNRASQESVVTKCKERYEARSLEAAQLYQLVRQGVSSKDAEKLRIKYEKTLSQSRQADQDYRTGVDKLAEIYKTWQTDMTTACIDYQKMEEDRFQFIRGNIWNYANFISGLCVSEDESCERIRLSLEKCDFEKDLATFLDKSATGSEIPKPMAYVPFSEDPAGAAQLPGQQQQNSIPMTQTVSSGQPPQPLPPLPSISTGFSSLFTNAFGLGSKDNNSNQMGSNSSVRQSTTQPLAQQQPSGIARRESAVNPSNAYDTHAAPSYDPNYNANAYGAASNIKPSVSGNMPPQHAPMPHPNIIAGQHKQMSHEPLDASFNYDPFDVPESVPILFSVRVLYDYDATAPEELTMFKGQTIPVIATHEDGWWEGLGSEDGRPRKGLFPSNFTEPAN